MLQLFVSSPVLGTFMLYSSLLESSNGARFPEVNLKKRTEEGRNSIRRRWGMGAGGLLKVVEGW